MQRRASRRVFHTSFIKCFTYIRDTLKEFINIFYAKKGMYNKLYKNYKVCFNTICWRILGMQIYTFLCKECFTSIVVIVQVSRWLWLINKNESLLTAILLKTWFVGVLVVIVNILKLSHFLIPGWRDILMYMYHRFNFHHFPLTFLLLSWDQQRKRFIGSELYEHLNQHC